MIAISVTVGHLAFPASFHTAADGSITAAVNEQDSLDDILAGALAVVSCPVGAWVDQPSFGVKQGLFSSAPVDAVGIANAIDQWEPRAQTTGSEYPDLLDTATRHVQLLVSAGTQDQ